MSNGRVEWEGFSVVSRSREGRGGAYCALDEKS